MKKWFLMKITTTGGAEKYQAEGKPVAFLMTRDKGEVWQRWLHGFILSQMHVSVPFLVTQKLCVIHGNVIAGGHYFTQLAIQPWGVRSMVSRFLLIAGYLVSYIYRKIFKISSTLNIYDLICWNCIHSLRYNCVDFVAKMKWQVHSWALHKLFILSEIFCFVLFCFPLFCFSKS